MSTQFSEQRLIFSTEKTTKIFFRHEDGPTSMQSEIAKNSVTTFDRLHNDKANEQWERSSQGHLVGKTVGIPKTNPTLKAWQYFVTSQDRVLTSRKIKSTNLRWT